MAIVYYRENKTTVKTSDLTILARDPPSKLLWIDLNHASPEDKAYVEEKLQVSLQTQQQAEEIELSSRYIELGNTIVVNANFLVHRDGYYANEAVSF
ncbi:MAG: magnesium and cobalt transport protein CorA, partial [Ferruginibacter sp.]|nr:magnesium and cobalt transport protein CorA [Cytophagales bacterium]